MVPNTVLPMSVWYCGTFVIELLLHIQNSFYSFILLLTGDGRISPVCDSASEEYFHLGSSEFSVQWPTSLLKSVERFRENADSHLRRDSTVELFDFWSYCERKSLRLFGSRISESRGKYESILQNTVSLNRLSVQFV